MLTYEFANPIRKEKVCVAVFFTLAEITELETELSLGVCVHLCVCLLRVFFFFCLEL